MTTIKTKTDIMKHYKDEFGDILQMSVEDYLRKKITEWMNHFEDCNIGNFSRVVRENMIDNFMYKVLDKGGDGGLIDYHLEDYFETQRYELQWILKRCEHLDWEERHDREFEDCYCGDCDSFEYGGFSDPYERELFNEEILERVDK